MVKPVGWIYLSPNCSYSPSLFFLLILPAVKCTDFLTPLIAIQHLCHKNWTITSFKKKKADPR